MVGPEYARVERVVGGVEDGVVSDDETGGWGGEGDGGVGREEGGV